MTKVIFVLNFSSLKFEARGLSRNFGNQISNDAALYARTDSVLHNCENLKPAKTQLMLTSAGKEKL
jgi:hypothetical protein